MSPRKARLLRFSLRPLALAIPIALAGAPVLFLSNPALAAEQTRRYDIPAGPLAIRLNQFAAQAGIYLAGDAALTAEKRSQPLKGEFGIEQALAILLGGSGLEALRTQEGRYELRSQAQASGTMSLDAMTVVDNQLGTITENTKSYTPGVIASATKLVLTPRETPQTVTVMTRQHMDDFSLTSIDQVMDHTPGITRTTYDTERSMYFARGFPITNYQYDGIPIQNNTEYSSGNTLSDMIVYDRVEVIKGASGLTTGAGSPGATLNLVRKKPTAHLAGHVSARAGRWDNYRSEFDISNALNESGTIRGRMVAAYQNQQWFMDRYKKNNLAYYGILEMDLTPDTLLTLGYDSNRTQPTGSSWGGTPIFDSANKRIHTSRSYNPATNWSSWEQYNHSFFTQLDHNFANGWVTRAYYTYQVNGYSAQLGSSLYGPDVDTGKATWYGGLWRGKTRSNAGELYASGPFELFGREHELVVGASYYRNHWKGRGYNSFSGTTDYYDWSGDVQKPQAGSVNYRNDELTNQRAVYATARFKPTDDLAVILGGRVTNYHLTGDNESRDSGVVTPFAGVVYDLNDNYSLYASYTKIFLPAANHDVNGGILSPNKGDSYEAGVKGEWFNGRLNASLAYFEIREDNRAVYSGYDNTRNWYLYEAKKAKTKGFELELTGELLPGWNIQTGYTHKIIRQDDTNQKLSTQEPEDLFKLYTTYRLPGMLNKLTIGGGAEYHGHTWTQNTTDYDYNHVTIRQGAYTLFNLMSKYQFTNKLSATLNVSNLFDRHYYTNIGQGTSNTRAYGEPRNMMLTTRWDF
ncbi:TonB-dependent siderophore receptor [Azomonas macrocytogenes]|uniref:Outer membrane receptor for ferric coprogen and ferric-rhodotorulic acid n=1 Tax=Azomonas macrocytogenes TaxID=69962 RepID=A0A839T2S0_AZOMA|nr:TonB-dependent siderophore receptor [Azomonas macrocytogenes]MBB3103847.1 outer membrane receptor for ferric coprogen and ferric-rhodotorulic acid [Azomonas macrocytogenes]